MPDCTCGYTVAIAPRFDLVSGKRGELQPGDFHVCAGCGTPLIYDSVTGWRPATLDEIFRTDPEARRVMARISIAIHRAHMALAGRGAGGMLN